MAADESHPVDETDEPTTQAADAGSDNEQEDSPWALLVFGILMIVAAGWIYWYFGKLETDGGEVRMPAIAWGVYEMLGKAGLAGLIGLMGAALTWSGVSGLRSQSE